MWRKGIARGTAVFSLAPSPEVVRIFVAPLRYSWSPLVTVIDSRYCTALSLVWEQQLFLLQGSYSWRATWSSEPEKIHSVLSDWSFWWAKRKGCVSLSVFFPPLAFSWCANKFSTASCHKRISSSISIYLKMDLLQTSQPLSFLNCFHHSSTSGSTTTFVLVSLFLI